MTVKPARTDALVEARDACLSYRARPSLGDLVRRRTAHVTRAVSHLDLDVYRGEILGLVGESGSGKTTTGRLLADMLRPDSGTILFEGKSIGQVSSAERRRRRRHIQMIFQEPHASLSPRHTVRYLLTEPYWVNRIPAEDRYSLAEQLELVGLSLEMAEKYPHELSGGQARRVGIARALSLKPRFVVADEPTSGLDVSAASGVLNLMKDLQLELGLTYLVITHDINAVGYLANRIAVMFLGELVEVGDAETVLDHPTHDYTKQLISAVPQIDDPNDADAVNS